MPAGKVFLHRLRLTKQEAGQISVSNNEGGG